MVKAPDLYTLKWMTFMACKLYLDKAVKFFKNDVLFSNKKFF